MKKCVNEWRGRPMYCINREADWRDDMSFNRINHKPKLWDQSISSAIKRKGWIDSGSSNVKTKTSDCVSDTDSQAIIVSLLLSAGIARARRPSPTVLLHPIHPQTKKHIQTHNNTQKIHPHGDRVNSFLSDECSWWRTTSKKKAICFVVGEVYILYDRSE